MSLLDAERDLVTVTTILVMRIRNLKMIESDKFDDMYPPIKESILRSLQTQEANLWKWIKELDERTRVGGWPQRDTANVVTASRTHAKKSWILNRSKRASRHRTSNKKAKGRVSTVR